MSSLNAAAPAQSIRQAFETVSGNPNRSPKRRSSSKAAPRITLRLSIEENEKLRELSSGMAVSAFVRNQLFGSDAARRKRRSHMPVKDQIAMSQALGLLGQSKIANNLNQLAYQVNTGSLLMDDEALSQINEAYGHVVAMRDALIRALGLVDAE